MDNQANFKPLCDKYRKCSGCQLQNMEYERQLAWKNAQIKRKIGSFCKVEPIIGMDYPNNYRNKLNLFFKNSKSNGMIAGIYQSANEGIVGIDDCMICDKQTTEIIPTLLKLMKSFKIKPYNTDEHTGYIRNVIIRKGNKTGEIALLFIVGKKENRFKPAFINALLKSHPNIKTIVLNFNDAKRLYNGERIEILYGNGKIATELYGKTFRISPDAFCQVNSAQTEILYSTALDKADLNKNDVMIDAYCGSGTIGIVASDKVKRVIGVEINSFSIADAKENAQINNVNNIEFFCDDSERFMQQNTDCGANVVVTDPPRAGCSKKFLDAICILSAQRVVYISCNVDSLARDLSYLSKRGYKAKFAQGVDMFPFTKGIETIVVLEKTN